MVTAEGEERTLKPISENQFLPPLQKTLLLHLAENSPKSKYGTNKAINGYYKSVWDAIDALEAKGILVKVKIGEYRGRQHPLYWLTTAGVFIALVEGTNPKTLLNRTLEIYPENKLLQCMVDLATILGTDTYRIAYSAILNKRKLEKTDLSEMAGTLLMKDLSLEQIKDLITILKKYPEQFGDLKEQTDQMRENLKKVELFLTDVKEEK